MGERVVEGIELADAPDRSAQSAGDCYVEHRLGTGLAHDAIGPHWFLSALQRQLSKRLELKEPSDQPMGRVTDNYRAVRGKLLKPCCDVRRRSEREILAVLSAAYIAGDYQAGMRGHANRQSHVESARSQNTTVSCRRSASNSPVRGGGGAPTGEPQLPQKRNPGGTSA